MAYRASNHAITATLEPARPAWPRIGRWIRIECVVIGAGVVGLAVARALAARGREVIVLESGRGDRHRHEFAQ